MMRSDQSTSAKAVARTAALASALAVPLFVLWVHRFIKSPSTIAYGLAYLVALVALVRRAASAPKSVSLPHLALKGPLLGYLAGLVGDIALLLVEGSRAANMISKMPGESLVTWIASPIAMGLWIPGCVTLLADELLRRRHAP